jgi:hypothetical protein
MTRVAVNGGVGTNQWEAVLVLVDRVNRDLPAVHSMTKIALCSVTAAMDINMAVLTLLARVSQNGIHVAALAGSV